MYHAKDPGTRYDIWATPVDHPQDARPLVQTEFDEMQGQVSPHGRPELVIYVENSGEYTVPLAAVAAVHPQKVLLNVAKLDKRLRAAIGHAHDAEDPNI